MERVLSIGESRCSRPLLVNGYLGVSTVEPGFFILLIFASALILRLIAGSMDTTRIYAYAASRGWKIRDKKWDPFGPGWFGDRSDRIYQVIFFEERGNVKKTHVKTSLFRGGWHWLSERGRHGDDRQP